MIRIRMTRQSESTDSTRRKNSVKDDFFDVIVGYASFPISDEKATMQKQ